jgi:hypothetical protein
LCGKQISPQRTGRVGWAKRKRAHHNEHGAKRWARRSRAFAHPTKLGLVGIGPRHTIASRERRNRMARTSRDERVTMATNKDKIDDAALALLYITLHDDYRAWKGMDWGVLGRLHEKGMIHDPVGKVKSVVFTP